MRYLVGANAVFFCFCFFMFFMLCFYALTVMYEVQIQALRTCVAVYAHVLWDGLDGQLVMLVCHKDYNK